MTGHTWAMREAVAKLVCPTCGAPAGLDCRTRSGNPAPVHRPRYAPLTLAWARGYVEAIRRGDRARKRRTA